jgi:hypothetical protein
MTTKVITNNHYARQRELYDVFRSAFERYGRSEDEKVVAGTRFDQLTQVMKLAFSMLAASEQERVDAYNAENQAQMILFEQQSNKIRFKAKDELRANLRASIDAIESLLIAPTDPIAIQDATSRLSAMQMSLEWMDGNPEERARREKIERFL